MRNYIVEVLVFVRAPNAERAEKLVATRLDALRGPQTIEAVKIADVREEDQ